MFAQGVHLSEDLTWQANTDCHEVIKYSLRGVCGQAVVGQSLTTKAYRYFLILQGIVGGVVGRAGIADPFPVFSPQELVGTAETDEHTALRGG